MWRWTHDRNLLTDWRAEIWNCFDEVKTAALKNRWALHSESLTRHPTMLCCHTPCHISGSCDLNTHICVYDNDKVVDVFIVHTQTESVDSDWFGACVFLASSPCSDTLCTDAFFASELKGKKRKESLVFDVNALHCVTPNCSGCSKAFWWKDIFYIHHRESYIFFFKECKAVTPFVNAGFSHSRKRQTSKWLLLKTCPLT